MRALVVPTRREREAVLQALPAAEPVGRWDGRAWRVGDLLVLEPGIGPDRAAALLPELGEALLPQPAGGSLWLVGWCGGLRSDLQVADLVLADATLVRAETLAVVRHPPDGAIATWAGRLAAAQGRRLALGPVLSSPRVLARADEKRAAAATGAVAVEMEAGPLARWAMEHALPFAHLRVVLDPVTSSLPTEDLGIDEQREAGEGSPLLWRALWRPRAWPAVWRLFRQVRIAGQALTDLAAALVAPDGPLSIGG